MQNKDLRRFNLGLNKDDNPTELQPGEYTDALNMRVASSTDQQGVGILESLQGEIELLINAVAQYYGGAIGGNFIYEGYEEVQIGNQVWMKQNWDRNYPGSKVYNDDETNREKYGGLYTWDMIHQVDFCPPGWRVPTKSDCNTLFSFLGGQIIAGGKMKEAGSVNWLLPNTSADDISGWTGLPGGKFTTIFDLLYEYGFFWIYDEISPVLNVDIIIVTKISGVFSMTLTGDGFIYVDWGDGSTEIYYLGNIPLTMTHGYTSGGTITIYNDTDFYSFIAPNNRITSIVISSSLNTLRIIDLSNNLLTNIILSSWGFTSLTEFCSLNLSHNLLNSLTIPASWQSLLGYLNVSYNNLVSFSLLFLYNFETINIEHNNLTLISLPSGVVLWKYFYANDNHLTEFIFNPISNIALETIAIQNNSIVAFSLPAVLPNITLLDISYNQISYFDSYASWGYLKPGLRHFDFRGNRITISPLNAILVHFDGLIGVPQWRGGDYLNLALGTSVAPRGTGKSAKVNLLAKLATIITNEEIEIGDLSRFVYIWTGNVIGNTMVSDTDGRLITITGKDFTEDWLPYASVATFKLPEDADFIAADLDNLWFDEAGNAKSVTLADLVDQEYYRTVIKITDEPPYEVYAIALLNPSLILTDAIREQLAADFWLSIFWGDVTL